MSKTAANMKILVTGSVSGNLLKFARKLSNINKKNGPFELVLCTGDFFSDTEKCKTEWKTLLQKSGTIDIPVFILGPSKKTLNQFYGDISGADDGSDLCTNVTYLGCRGFFKLMSGLQIAYASGSALASSSGGGISPDDNTAFSKIVENDEDYVGVDLLITSVWPKDITRYVKTHVQEVGASNILSDIASKLKPRYHFSCHQEQYFERAPYRNHHILRGEQQHVTRFVSLAPFGNAGNEKSLYAFSITPLERISREELVKQPADTTEFPFSAVEKISAEQVDDAANQEQFFFADRKRKSDGMDERVKKVAKGAPKFSGPCWFCLGSKEVEKHLVVSVSETCYLSLPKGGLNDDNVMICTVSHHNSTVVLDEGTRLELEKYKLALRKMFRSEGKHMIVYERNYYSQHLQLQVHGVPSDVHDAAKECFQDLAEEYGLEMIDVPDGKDLSELVAITTPYFCVELDSGERLLHKVKGKMPLQFGREVLAHPNMLNLPGRVEWKECKLEKEEEIAETKTFRKRFAKFDFNFDD